MDRRKEKKSNQKPKELRGKKYIEYICSLYNDSYTLVVEGKESMRKRKGIPEDT